MSTDPMSDEQKRIRIAEACGWTKVEWYEDNQGPPILHGFPPPVVGLGKDGEWESKGAEHSKHVPNFLFDLNAMHEAENYVFGGRYFETGLDNPLATKYWIELGHLCDRKLPTGGWNNSEVDKIRATARQRADAFLAVLGPAPQL